MERRQGTSGWAGWAAFAGIMMILIGFFHAMAGFVGIVDDSFFVVGRHYVFEFDTTTWGWIHLVGGLAVLAAGFGVFSGAVWARSIGVIVASISALANFAFLPYYPVWSMLMIALDIFVIFALTTHGRELAE